MRPLTPRGGRVWCGLGGSQHSRKGGGGLSSKKRETAGNTQKRGGGGGGGGRIYSPKVFPGMERSRPGQEKKSPEKIGRSVLKERPYTNGRGERVSPTIHDPKKERFKEKVGKKDADLKKF